MRSLRRSLLFVPGNNPAMLLAAPSFGADALILDLEDAVAINQKDAARLLICSALQRIPFGQAERVVRVNPLSTPFGEQDVEAALRAQPDTLLVPKAEPKSLRQVAAMIDRLAPETMVIALIETALGVEQAYQCGLVPHVTGLFFGAEDFTADIGTERTADSSEILYARQRIVVGAVAAHVDAIDTPFTGIDVGEDFYQDVLNTRRLGFSGKACINPRHVEGVHRILAPTEQEIRHAQRVLATDQDAKERGLGAVTLDGKMIDAPIVTRAHKTLLKAGLLDMEGRNAGGY